MEKVKKEYKKIYFKLMLKRRNKYLTISEKSLI
jgi:hypothetical protein